MSAARSSNSEYKRNSKQLDPVQQFCEANHPAMIERVGDWGYTCVLLCGRRSNELTSRARWSSVMTRSDCRPRQSSAPNNLSICPLLFPFSATTWARETSTKASNEVALG
eukprot:4140076-Amphidinium_carterae.1